MAAYNIPLEVKSPQIDDPGQVASRVVGIKDLIQRGQLQQIQAQEMQQQAQEKAMQLATQRALNQSIADNVSQGPDGGFTVNHNGVANSLAKSGFGTAVPGYLGNIAKLQKEQADVTKDQLANKATMLEQTTQALQGVKDQAGYDAALPMVKDSMKGLGMDPASVPAQYDPAWVGQAISHGMKATDFAKAAHEAADLARLKLQEAPKTVGEWRTQIGADLGNASSQQQLDSKMSKWRAAGAPPEILNLFPNSYSADTQQQLQEAAIPPAQRQKALEEQITMAGRQLNATKTAADYTRAYDSLPPKVRTVFKDPSQWDANAAADALTAARTPDQQERSEDRRDAAADRAANAREANDIRRDLGQQTIDLRREIHDSKPPVGSTARQRMADADADKHDKFQTQEQQAWDLHGELGSVLQVPDGQKFVDPTGKTAVEREMNPAWRKRMESAYKDAQTKATQFQNTQKDIRRRNGWGEFGEQQTQPPAPAQQPPAKPTATGQQPPAQQATPAQQPAANAAPSKPVMLRLPDDMAKKLGKTHISFPNQEAAQKFAAAAGLTIK